MDGAKDRARIGRGCWGRGRGRVRRGCGDRGGVRWGGGGGGGGAHVCAACHPCIRPAQIPCCQGRDQGEAHEGSHRLWSQAQSLMGPTPLAQAEVH